MSPHANLLVGLTMGLNLLALGSNRLTSLVRATAFQGMALGVLPILLEARFDWSVVTVAAITMVVKGFVMPTLLRRAMRAVHVDREVEPLLGFVPSLLLGAAGAIAAVAVARRLPMLPEHAGSLLVPGAFATVVTGFILLVGRVTAIAQVCGYLIMENGIYLFGMLLIRSTPLLVESGILLDLTVGVFVIGIIVDRIQRAFDSLDTRKLTVLRE